MALVPGTRIGPYDIVSTLGAGGMGEVYRARDTRLGREVAIKVLPDAFAHDQDRLARFRREAQVLAALNHPNIASVHGLEESAGAPAIVMELVDGPTLADRVALAPAGMPVTEVVAIAAQVIDALEVAHGRGIIHRDLKPANIKIGPTGIVKVLDFGLAKELHGADSAAMSAAATTPATLAGSVVGTVGYMSPEQARGETVDARSDLFSLGAVLYEIATGRPAFDGAVPTLVIDGILHATPRSPRTVNALVPPLLDRLIMRLLEKDRTSRYQSASDVRGEVAQLRRASDTAHLSAAPPSRARIAIALVAVFAAATVWWMWPRAARRVIPDRSAYEQITHFAASATSPALSADGRMMAFVQGSEWFFGAGQIFVKALPDGEPVQLTHDRLEKMSPAFSPDGSRIVYTVAAPPSQWDLWVVPALGGESRLLMKNAASLTWLPNRRVMFSEITDGLHMRVVTSDENSNDKRAVYTPGDQQGMAHWSHLSPDGTWVLIVEMEQGVWRPCRLVPLDGSSSGRTIGPNGQCVSAAWSPDGQWMYTSSSPGGTFHIWRQRFPDGTPEQITNGPTEEQNIAMARDGRSFLTTLGSRQQELWIGDERVERAVGTDGDAFVPDLPTATVQPFSIDGRRLFYLVRRGGPRFLSVGNREQAGELWMTDLESGHNQPIIQGFDVAAYDVSRDGTQVVFAAIDQADSSHLWIARLDGQLPPRQVSSIEADMPRFGAGDAILARVSEGAERTSYLYRMTADGREPQRMSDRPILFFMSASPDGAWAIVRVPAQAGRRSETIALPTSDGPVVPLCVNCQADWSADRRGLVLWLEDSLRTVVLSLEPGRMLPRLPAAGIQSEADLKGLALISSQQGRRFPGVKPAQYAYGRGTIQRNIYRVPVP